MSVGGCVMELSESFGFEPRWLRLLLKALPHHPQLFHSGNVADAQYILGGLGNRQVLALRDWATGIGLIGAGRTGSFSSLTPLGALITAHDPELEEDGSYWAIHHSLCRSTGIWFYASYSNLFGPGVFSRDEIKSRLKGCRAISESVIEKKCVVPLLHTMKSTRLGSELGVLSVRNGTLYERRRPDERRLHEAVVAFMLYDWAERSGRRTVNVSELAMWGGVANYLALSNDQLVGFLERIQDRYAKKVLWVSQTAGLGSIAFAEDVPSLALLRAYYIEQLEGVRPEVAFERAVAAE